MSMLLNAGGANIEGGAAVVHVVPSDAMRPTDVVGDLGGDGARAT